MKKVAFKIVASVFTLMAQIVYEKRPYSVIRLQVLSNLLTASILNYALVKIILIVQSVGLPIWAFLTTRYYIYSYILTCKCCCCIPKAGKIEDFKYGVIREMLLDKDTKSTFLRYCLDNKLDPELKDEMEKVKWKNFADKRKKKRRNLLQK